MSDFPTHIRLVGLKDPARVEAFFCSDVVDIAYAIETGPSSLDVFVEDAEGKPDWPTEETRAWLTGIMRGILDQCHESADAKIIFLGDLPTQSGAA